MLRLLQEKRVQALACRSGIFLLLSFIFLIVRTRYTFASFGYNLLISDGFIYAVPYVLFGLFLFFFWKAILEKSQDSHSWSQTWVIGGASIGLLFAPTGLSATSNPIDIILIELLVLATATFLLFVAVFGVRFVKIFFFELSTVALLFVPFMLAPLLIDHFWEYSSRITLFGLQLLFPLLGITHSVDPTLFKVRVNDFAVFIGPPCAGIHSLLAFGVLYIATLLLLWQRGYRIRRGRSVMFFLAGLTGVFLLNSLRVLLIILVGAYHSPEFATTLFHSYIGALLLIVFVLLYLSFVVKRVIRSG